MSKDNFYEPILELIYSGSYERAAESIRELRSRNSLIWDSEVALMQNLLAARIALKSGNVPDTIESLQISLTTHPFLAGEVCLVKGITLFQTGKFAEGMEQYQCAKSYFEKSGHKDKELMAWYNVLIGETHRTQRDLKDSLELFRAIELEANRNQSGRILGLVHRQKSYFYKEASKWNAALLEAERSIVPLELSGAASDYHLGLINICEILIELQRPDEAKKYFEMIVPPLDKRVRFPYAFIEARIWQKELSYLDLSQSCPHFLHRYRLWKNAIQENTKTETGNLKDQPLTLVELNKNTIEIHFNGKTVKLNKHLLEYRIIEILKEGPHSKHLICEKLWPAYSEVHHLDNRLHRLISRLNKKIDGLILYSNKTYKLCQ